MKRQTLLASLMLASGVLALSPALAEEAHHPDQKPGATAAPGADQAQAIQKMQANTKKMQSQLEQMAKSKNPQERMRLMQEHQKTMQENMAMGQGMMGKDCPMMGGQGGMGMMGMMGGMGGMGQGMADQPGMAGKDDMMKRMEMMEKRMDMMQMMMQKNMGGMPQPGTPPAK